MPRAMVARCAKDAECARRRLDARDYSMTQVQLLFCALLKGSGSSLSDDMST